MTVIFKLVRNWRYRNVPLTWTKKQNRKDNKNTKRSREIRETFKVSDVMEVLLLDLLDVKMQLMVRRLFLLKSLTDRVVFYHTGMHTLSVTSITNNRPVYENITVRSTTCGLWLEYGLLVKYVTLGSGGRCFEYKQRQYFCSRNSNPYTMFTDFKLLRHVKTYAKICLVRTSDRFPNLVDSGVSKRLTKGLFEGKHWCYYYN